VSRKPTSLTTQSRSSALFAERRFTWHEQPFTPREIGLAYAFSGLLGIIVQGGLIGRSVTQVVPMQSAASRSA
jgi:hypothetical protein